MSGNKAAIFAVYPTHTSAEAALNALRARGFAASDISVVAPHSAEAPATTADMLAVSPEPAAAKSGPVPALGVALGWLVNLSTVAVSGAMYVAAGPIMAAFKGMSDAMLGIVDALTKFGIPADTAKKYEERVKEGATLLSIHADDPGWIARGKEIFEQTGAEDISSIYDGPMADRPGLTVPHSN